MPLPYIVAICITVVAKSAIKAGDTVTTVGVDQVDTGAIDTRVVHAFVDVLKHTRCKAVSDVCVVHVKQYYRLQERKCQTLKRRIHALCTVITRTL